MIEPLESRALLSTITVSSLGDNGPGTLRAAIQQANLDSTADTIAFAPALTGTIDLTTALPDLSSDLTIAGPGPSVLIVARSAMAGTPDFRVFTVSSGAEVAISGLTITGGQVFEAYGGGIFNAGTLTLTNVDLTGNSGGWYGGGAIYNAGTLSVVDSTLSGNSSWSPNILEEVGGSGGAIFNDAGGTASLAHCTFSSNSAYFAGCIDNYSTMSVTDCTFSNNSSYTTAGCVWNSLAGAMTLSECDFTGNSAGSAGGALVNNGESLVVTECSFNSNSGPAGGGAIVNETAATIDGCYFSGNSTLGDGGAIEATTLTIANSTFSDNSASDWGGAIAHENGGSLTVINSTFTGNSAGAPSTTYGSDGGAIANRVGLVTIVDCTISGNFSRDGAGCGIASGSPPNASGISPTPASYVLIDTIVAGNTSNFTTPFSDVAATVAATSSHNLIGNGAGLTGISNGTNGNLIGTASAPLNPMLGPLANNGGPTWTMALLQGSPAIDAGVAVHGVTTDQRGVTRPLSHPPDIGAYEVQPPPIVTRVVRHGAYLEPTTIIVTFSHAMDAAAAESLVNYRLAWIGDEECGKKRVVVRIPITSAVYNAANFSVTLYPTRRLPLRYTYWLSIRGKPTGGLEDAWGVYLDGKKNGHQGSNDVVRINSRLLRQSTRFVA